MKSLENYVPPLNGGLYTGEPFEKNAPWGNIPINPDVDFIIPIGLSLGNPPKDAFCQFPGTTRAGNNHQNMTPCMKKQIGMYCNSRAEECNKEEKVVRFNKYYTF